MPPPRTLARAWGAAAMLGVLAGGLCFVVLRAHHGVKPEVTAGDFQWSVRDARDLLAGRDPYRYPARPLRDSLPYPRCARRLAARVDAGSVGRKRVHGIVGNAAGVRHSALRRRMAFGHALELEFHLRAPVVQWTPLLCALWFLPALAAIALIKPNIALPLLLAGEFASELWRHRPGNGSCHQRDCSSPACSGIQRGLWSGTGKSPLIKEFHRRYLRCR